MRFRPGIRPGPRWGAYLAPPDPLAGLRGPNSKKRGGKGTGKEGREGGEEVEEGQGTGEWKGRGIGMPEKGEGRRGRSKERRGGEGRKVRTPPPSIPACAPGISGRHIQFISPIRWRRHRDYIQLLADDLNVILCIV